MTKNINELNQILNKYSLSNDDKEIIWNIIFPIFEHDEFQKRMNPEVYAHHDHQSLGSHIINDAVVSYILAKRKQQNNKNINLDLAVIIAMFHDLYELPWQNMDVKKKMFVNKHGFVHPIEGAINATTWYPDYFASQKQSEIIIDGIIHHMYPFPVRAIDGTNIEINNEHKLELLDTNIKNLIISSTLRSKIGHISICRSKFIEGRIMSTADKIISIGKDLTNFNAIRSCITGNNPNLDSYQRVKRKKR